MNEERIAKIVNRAICTYGADAQLKMAIEEMSELTKAICKLWRADTEEDFERAIDAAIEETADVQIMLYQLYAMIGAGEFNAKIEEKLERLEARLDEKEKEERGDEKS